MKISDIPKLFEILKELKIDPKEGVMKSKYGVRYVLFSNEMISAIEDDLREIVGKGMAIDLTYNIGYKTGIRLAKSIKKFDKGTPYQIARKCIDSAQMAGWGKHKMNISWDVGEGTILVYNSPIAILKKGEKIPVCNFHRGLLAGSATVIASEKVICEEVNCLAMGDDFCKFILRTESRDKLIRKNADGAQ